MQTILEVNGQKMPERITATRAAIAGRLHDLEHDSAITRKDIKSKTRCEPSLSLRLRRSSG